MLHSIDQHIGSSNLDDLLSALVKGELVDEHDRKRVGAMLRDEAGHHYDTREPFRRLRSDARDMYRGKHWNETVKDSDTGALKTEKQFLEDSGRVPVVMNLVGNVINNIDGQFRQNKSGRLAFAVEREDEQAVEMINLARRATRRYNESEVIEADQFKEHILSGAAAFKSMIKWDEILQRHEVKDSEIDQTKFFYNLDIHDRRLNGLRIIGELHDVTISNVVHKFAKSRADEERIRELYDKGLNDPSLVTARHDFDTFDAMDFLTPSDPSMVRVVEAWRPVYRWVRYGMDPLFEHIPNGFGLVTMPDNEIARIQNERRQNFEAGFYDAFGLTEPPLLEMDTPRYDPFWHYFFLTPEGDILQFGATPYAHGEHPYSAGLALLVDGETWGVMTNIKDPQRWLNRILIHLDHQLSAGGQGMLGVDEDVLQGSNLTAQQVANEYAKPNGVLAMKKGNKGWDSILHQFQGKGLQPGWAELVPMLTQFIQQISGVSEAAQGFAPKSGTPAALYQQQIIQANMNVMGYVQTYFETLRRKDRKELKLIQQAFQEQRTFRGRMGGEVQFDPQRVRNMDWDVAMGEVADTAVYRQLWEGDLQNLLQAGFFGPPGPQSLLTYLEASSHPQADYLKQVVTNSVMGAVQGMDPGAAALADPNVLAQLAQQMPTR